MMLDYAGKWCLQHMDYVSEMPQLNKKMSNSTFMDFSVTNQCSADAQAAEQPCLTGWLVAVQQ